MPLIFPSNTLSAGGFSVDNSCRFDDGATASLTRTTETPTNPDIYTFSVWIKRGNLGLANAKIFSVKTGSYGEEKLEFNADDLLWRKTDADAGNTDYERETDAVFRDPGAWMHILIAYDSSDGTPGDRMKVYINGVQETSFGGSVDPDSSETSWLNTASLTLYIGAAASVTQYFDGYMAELAFVDGVAHAVTDFGEFDEDSPTIWKPKDISSGITWGNNGFYLDFEDSSALGNDVSGNDNDFTVSNLAATDQATDTPTNNFATLNTLAANSGYTFSDGNLSLAINSVNDEEKIIVATFGASSGTWYWEVKNTSSSNPNYIHAGYSTDEFISNYISGSQSTSNYTANNGYWNGIQGQGTASAGITVIRAGTASNYTVSNTFLQNSIAMFAIDLDNSKGWVGLDGTWINDSSGNTGNPSTGAYPTWDSNDLLSTDKIWLPSITGYYSQPTCSLNFGNPPYANTSDAADDNGYGAFEFAPPSGYYAVCTKNLAEFGG